MLDELRDRIRGETRPRRATTPSTATRVITVTLSDRLNALRSLQEEAFPSYPPELASIRPWLTASSERFAEQIESDIRKAFGIDLAAQFTRAGITVRRSSLIVVLGDMSDPNFEDLFAKVSTSLKGVEAQSGLSGHSFFYIGVILFDSAATNTWNLNLRAVSSDLYAKLFLLDTRNSRGLELSAEDRLFQILHVLRYLECLPESCHSDEEFVEWIQNASPVDGYASSLGGSTIYYPVDALLETACVQAGARVLSDSLLHFGNDNRQVFYTGKFKLESGLASLADLESELGLGAANPFQNVSASTSDPDVDRALLASLKSIDDKLESFASEHELALQSKVEDRMAAWKHLLEDYVDAIVTSENGGLRLAAVFLDEMVGSIRSTTEALSPFANAPDASHLFSKTTAAVNGLPSVTALAVRALAGGGIGGYAALSGPFSTSSNLILAAGVPLAIVAFAGIWVHAARAKAERFFAELKGILASRWELLLGSAVRRVATQLLLDLSDEANQLKQQVERSIVRSEEAVQWFIGNHAAPMPRSSTLHWPLLQGRAELVQAVNPLVELPGLSPSSYLSARRPWQDRALLPLFCCRQQKSGYVAIAVMWPSVRFRL